jgi:hypothetical protein
MRKRHIDAAAVGRFLRAAALEGCALPQSEGAGFPLDTALGMMHQQELGNSS